MNFGYIAPEAPHTLTMQEISCFHYASQMAGWLGRHCNGQTNEIFPSFFKHGWRTRKTSPISLSIYTSMHLKLTGRIGQSVIHISPAFLWTLDLNFFVCRRISFFVFVIVNCRANGENSISFSLRSPWKSWSASPFIVFRTNAIAFFRCELNNPLTEVANPSPAPSLGFLRNAGSWSELPASSSSLSLKLKSLAAIKPAVGSFWLVDLALNFLPCKREISNV